MTDKTFPATNDSGPLADYENRKSSWQYIKYIHKASLILFFLINFYRNEIYFDQFSFIDFEDFF